LNKDILKVKEEFNKEKISRNLKIDDLNNIINKNKIFLEETKQKTQDLLSIIINNQKVVDDMKSNFQE
jgi:hypothetical protein